MKIEYIKKAYNAVRSDESLKQRIWEKIGVTSQTELKTLVGKLCKAVKRNVH